MFDAIDHEDLGTLPAVPDVALAEKLPRGYLSVSQASQYLKCGEAYYRRYVLDAAIPSTSFQVQGRGVHKAAEKLHLSMIDSNIISEEEMVQVYSDLHDVEIQDATIDTTEDDEIADTTEALKDVGIKLTKLYYKVAMGLEHNKTTGEAYPMVKPTAAERIIRANIVSSEGLVIPFLGVIDLEEADSIADLKTKKRAAPQGEVDNSLQLSLYAHVTGKPFVRHDQLVKPTKKFPSRFIRMESVRTRNEVLHAIDVVSEIAVDIAAGRFRKTNPENWWCTQKWCPYWDDCRGRKR